MRIFCRGDEKAKRIIFRSEFRKLNDHVRKNGKKIPDDILKPSELINYIEMLPEAFPHQFIQERF